MTTSTSTRGLICNERTVLAILAGKQTQDRRPLKQQPHPDFLARGLVNAVVQDDGKIRWFMADGLSEETNFKSPFGVPGDRLYVREAFSIVPLANNEGGQCELVGPIYRADGESAFDTMPAEWEFCGKWTPSIHMPRKFSRITLLVKRVWIERVIPAVVLLLHPLDKIFARI